MYVQVVHSSLPLSYFAILVLSHCYEHAKNVINFVIIFLSNYIMSYPFSKALTIVIVCGFSPCKILTSYSYIVSMLQSVYLSNKQVITLLCIVNIEVQGVQISLIDISLIYNSLINTVYRYYCYNKQDDNKNIES